ncbi:MAG: NADP-dependent malic enzyme [Deltaproteobacteria bacterium]|nr:NADP-dependent malic enzyme [Deltaproteobacteria bacterium]
MKIPEIIRVRSAHRPGSLARVLDVIAAAGLVVEGLHAVTRDHLWTTWEITLETDESERVDRVLAQLAELPNAAVLGRSDRVFVEHRGGKIEIRSRQPIKTVERLRDVYTPGVARVCLAIQADPERARELTWISRAVAVVTNGTAILGLGHIGPLAGLPVMEGKAALMAELAGLSGVPILIDETDPQKVIDVVTAIAPSFGAIHLEDIRAPECFEIERALVERLPIPVMHDDQHGTAVVVLAALLGAAQRSGVDLQGSVVGQIGLGAAGLGICDLLVKYGVRRVLGADRNPSALERVEALGGEAADLARVMAECDVVVATTGVKGLIKPEMVREGQIILALSNPEPEIEPDVAIQAGARYATDGKVVNNLLGYPGIFRGALEAGATRITDAMLIAAAKAIHELATGDALVPSPLELVVHERVAAAVSAAAAQAP